MGLLEVVASGRPCDSHVVVHPPTPTPSHLFLTQATASRLLSPLPSPHFRLGFPLLT